jgi:hypothetical protein
MATGSSHENVRSRSCASGCSVLASGAVVMTTSLSV